MKSEIPAATKLYDIILWLMPQAEKFPRDYKFATVGDRIINVLLDSLETLIEMVYGHVLFSWFQLQSFIPARLSFLRISR